jgi:N-methylhydantoinase A
MAGAARAHATDRGIDHRAIPLLAFGGAGPVHACQVGQLLQSRAVIFPPQASVLSAYGTLVAPARLDLVRSAVTTLADLDWDDVEQIYNELTTEARTALAEAGTPAEQVRFEFGADLRYAGQQTEIGITLPADPRVRRDSTTIAEIFSQDYLAHYGVAPSHVPVEIVNWRLVALGPAAKILVSAPERGPGAPPKGQRAVHLWDGAMVPVHDRHSLALDQIVQGPALIEERETTIVIPPGWQAVADSTGCVIATQGGRNGQH